MDRTAIASVIVGLGVTIAAMVFPTKYPRVPQAMITGIWWFGIALIILGITYLVTEHPISDLWGVAKESSWWLAVQTLAIQRLPGFWIVVAFLFGIVANSIVFPYIKKRIRNDKLSTGEWFSPREAIQRFVKPEILLRQKQAHSLLAELSGDDKKRPLAEYLVTRADADVIDNLYDQIGDGHLLAKGYPVKRGKTQNFERLIDYTFWKLRVVGRMIDLDTGEASNIIDHFKNVTIRRVSEPTSNDS